MQLSDNEQSLKDILESLKVHHTQDEMAMLAVSLSHYYHSMACASTVAMLSQVASYALEKAEPEHAGAFKEKAKEAFDTLAAASDDDFKLMQAVFVMTVKPERQADWVKSLVASCSRIAAIYMEKRVGK